MKNKIKKIVEKISGIKVMHYAIVQVFVLSFFTTMIIEILSKRSFLKMIKWMFMHPVIFIINWMIVSIPYSIAIALKRRYAMYCLVAFLWILIGVIDCIVISSRVTPFTATDIKLVSSVFSVFTLYIKVWQLILIIAAIILVLGLIVYGFFKLPQVTVNYSRLINSLWTLVVGGLCLIYVMVSMQVGLIETNFVNLRNAYQDYGLAYCFSNSIFNTGIKKPKDYSQQKVDDIVSDIATPENAEKPSRMSDDNLPNVIFIQLESFFDVNRLRGVKFTEDPIPTMTSLYENYCSGLLSVPSISAGTANTEFEVLTGMNMDDFGPGEYPYKTILTEKVAESMAYNLAENGYATHAIHDNVAGFYGRNIVYPNLGLSNFTSIEFMTDVEYNQLGWARDKILEKYIIEALDSTDNSDYVFAVSVQGHGAYPDEDVLDNQSLLISLDGLSGEVGEYNLAYYLEQLREMDNFVKDLIFSLETRKEKTVLVLYGDHLPGFDFTESDLNKGTLYDTEYAIWCNYDLCEPVKKNMEAYELSSYVCELLGYDNGLINKLHQNKSGYAEQEYLDKLKTLEYDMLYGDMLCWNGTCPYTPPRLAYGYDEIKITDIKAIGDPKHEGTYYLGIYGENFNTYSLVYLNDERLDTIYVDKTELFVPEIRLEENDVLTVVQYEVTGGMMYTSVPYILSAEKLGLQKK